MFYHLPISVQWNPVRFCDQLQQQEVDAIVVRSDIHLTFSSQYCERWRELLSHQIARRSRSLLHTWQPHGCVRHYPERFLRNLELRIQHLMVPPDEPQLSTVQTSLQEVGAILLDAPDVEYGIAYRNCSNHVAIAEYRREIERLVDLKQQYIDDMNFEKAAETRDAEYEVRAKLDTLLFHGR